MADIDAQYVDARIKQLVEDLATGRDQMEIIRRADLGELIRLVQLRERMGWFIAG